MRGEQPPFWSKQQETPKNEFHRTPKKTLHRVIATEEGLLEPPHAQHENPFIASQRALQARSLPFYAGINR